MKFGRVKDKYKNVDKKKVGRIKGWVGRRNEDVEIKKRNGVGDNYER